MNDLLRNRKVLYAVVAVVAIAVAGALIGVSLSGGGKKAASTAITTTAAGTGTTATGTGGGLPRIRGIRETTSLFRGVPQRLNELGNPKAPVTMVEFADLQCPFCREYTLSALPSLVTEYVRPGKAKFVFSGMHFIGPDSEKALRAVYAAGLQHRLWQYLDLLYKSQGAENSGWVTDDLLRSIGASIPGFDTKKMLADMGSEEVTNAIAVSDQQAQSASVSSTPTFFAGKTGGTLEHVNVTALTPEAFRPTLDALTG